MTKVYFDLQLGDAFVRDLEGQDFNDLADAKAEAEASLHEMVAGDIENQRPLQPRSITIRDQHGSTLATVEMKGRVTMVQDTATDAVDTPNGDEWRNATAH